jgi:hypothetical protein
MIGCVCISRIRIEDRLSQTMIVASVLGDVFDWPIDVTPQLNSYVKGAKGIIQILPVKN